MKRKLTTRGTFTRLALAIRQRMEQPGRHFCAIRNEDSSVAIVRRVGTVDTPVGVVRDLRLEPRTLISTGGLIEERQQLRGILAELRGAA